MTLYKGKQIIANNSGYHPTIFSCEWSDHLKNDIQWLRADNFSYHSGSVYVTAYNELLSEYNNASSTTVTEGSITFKRTPKGYKIADASQETAILNKYNSDGIAWYYILDTANTQFKLPRTKFGFEGLRGNVGDDISESLPNITGSVVNGGADDEGPLAGSSKGTGAFTASYNGNNGSSGGSTAGAHNFDFNASRCSTTYQDNAPVQERATQMYLYFYVGEYAQSAIEQTAGITTEQLNNKVDINLGNFPKPYLKTCYVNGTSGYNIWSNGYCEQWGEGTSSSSGLVITFLKQFKDTNYNISAINNDDTTGANNYKYTIYPSGSITSSSMKLCSVFQGTWFASIIKWKASGYLAEGEY